MDYKKAYKEARKRAEEIFTNECSSESTKKCCIEIFPDLANKELSNFEGALFSAFSDAWQQYLLGEEVDVEQWTKEHSEELLEAAKEDLHPVEKTDEQQTAKSDKELVFPHFNDGLVPSESLLSIVLGPLPEGFDIDKELELMWEERAK